MDTIKMYIENLFQSLPKTAEVVRAKEELIGMMEDKYNELKFQGKSENEAIGIVISEFGNIDELKEELGISNNSYRSNDFEDNMNQKQMKVRTIALEEAKDFVVNTSKFAIKIAVGAMLCILSVVPLIVLGGLSEVNSSMRVFTGLESTYAGIVPEKPAIAIGLTVLFIFISMAVALFIISGLQYEKYSYIKKERFVLDHSATNYIAELKEKDRTNFAIKITLGVMLCILSVIPVVIAGLLFEGVNDAVPIICVGVMLIIVAMAVFLFITAGMKRDSYMQLLQEEEYSPRNKDKEDLAGKVGSVYWPIVTAGYLGWSFLTMDWGITWIIWPVAGVLFGGIAAICNLIAPEKKGRN